WALVDYAEVARYLDPHAEQLADAADIRPGMEVADVAAGNGNFAIAAARRAARVIASDLTPKMIELGRTRTETKRLTVGWQAADAEQLPLPAIASMWRHRYSVRCLRRGRSGSRRS